MIIVLHGINTFLTKQKRDEIIASYRVKFPQGLSFFLFDEESRGEDIKTAIENISLFEEKKLIVCKNILKNIEEDEMFFEWLKKKNTKEDQNTVVVFSEDRVLVEKKNKNIAWLLEKPTVSQQADVINPARLPAWIEKEAQKHNATIDRQAITHLIDACGDDLWCMVNEIKKCATYNRTITKETVQLLVPTTAQGLIFEGLSALADGNIKKASAHFYALLNGGEEFVKMLGAIVFHFRAMVQARSLLDMGMSKEQIQKEIIMHPFALQKAITRARATTLPELKKTYRMLRDADYALKTGGMTPEDFFERLLLGV